MLKIANLLFKHNRFRATFSERSHHHVGMVKKPLMPYNPIAQRSRLTEPTVVMPYKNSSQIVIGDRASYNQKQWLSVNKMFQKVPNLHEATTNGGILAAKVKWHRAHTDLV